MRLLWILWILPINGFAKLPFIKTFTTTNNKQHVREPRMIQNMEYFQHFKQGSLIGYPEKVDGFIELTRIQKNFIPTSLLVLISGLVSCPTYWRTWLLSKPFISSFFMVHLLTSASMVINDIYDIELDKINNPRRPLVKGIITIKEAKRFFVFLTAIYSVIGWKFLPFLKHIWIGSLLGIIFYTPIFKKLTLIKNLVCSGIVTMTVPFVGFSTLSTIPIGSLTYGLDWMYFTMFTLFVHSFYMEILLDILDKKGDAENNIRTMPVVFGKKNTLYFLSFALLGCFYGNLFHIMYLIGTTTNVRKIYQSVIMIVVLAITYQPLFYNSVTIIQQDCSREYIGNAIKSVCSSLFHFFAIFLGSLLL